MTAVVLLSLIVSSTAAILESDVGSRRLCKRVVTFPTTVNVVYSISTLMALCEALFSCSNSDSSYCFLPYSICSGLGPNSFHTCARSHGNSDWLSRWSLTPTGGAGLSCQLIVVKQIVWPPPTFSMKIRTPRRFSVSFLIFFDTRVLFTSLFRLLWIATSETS